MRKIQPILFIRNRSGSLFLRLIIGFLCIVLMLASLNVYSLTVSRHNVKQEVEKYNTLLLNNAKDSYEKHLNLIQQQMLLFFSSEDILNLQKSQDPASYPRIISEITRWTTVPYFYIDNIVFYSKRNDLVLEKGTSTDGELMFNVFYKSADYPLDFWQRQFAAPDALQVYPASSVSNVIFDTPQPLGEQMPLVIKRQSNRDFYMIVYLDAVKMYNAFNQSIYRDFVIYDEAGVPLFSRADPADPLLSLDELRKFEGEGKLIRDGKYYFLKRGTTGFTYVSRVPVDRIAEQTRINVTLWIIVVAAIALSVLCSFLFAARINNPLRKVIESIRQMNDDAPYRSKIKEFDLISSELRGKRQLSEQISFINHLKAIRTQGRDAAKLNFADKPFTFVLFHVQSEMREPESQETLQNWLYYMRIFIDSKLKPAYPDALTLQIERDQILSLVFGKEAGELGALLAQMKAVFDQDREHGTVTIAVTQAYSNASQLTAAYEEAQQRAGQRLLTDETQIIDKRADAQGAIGFTPDQDKEFEANLKAGNAQQLAALLEQLFARWRRKEPTADALLRFAETVQGKIRGAATPYPLPGEELDAILGEARQRIGRCRTVKALEALLLEWVTRTADAVRDQKEEKHPITAQIIAYINEHLAEEIYLDVLAAQFKMSGGYVSFYFKSKTGVNIVDYINETRIAKASSLLADEGLKIRDVAEAVGYKNITSFNRMFKKYTGLTPSEYRSREASRPGSGQQESKADKTVRSGEEGFGG